jgi:hypothetical protein
MLKKLIFGIMAVAAILTTAGMMTSCEPQQYGTVLYTVNMGTFDDNMDVLRNAVEKDFEAKGLEWAGAGHNYVLEGEVKACNKKATAIFQECCKAVDQDRSKLALPLALKGVTISMVYCYGSSEEHELTTYTFVEEDK